LNVQGAGGLRQTEIHKAYPFMPEPSASEVEVTIRKLKSYKSPGSDQIPAKLIQAGREVLHSEIHEMIMLIWNKEFCHQWKESLHLFTKTVIKISVVIIKAYDYCQLHTNFYLTFFSLG
jgi:hypothetical protein